MNILSWIAAASMLVAQFPARPEFQPPPLRKGTAAIHGRVLDSATEKPVAGVEVNILDADPDADRNPRAKVNRARGASTRTNTAGEFSFTGIAAGMYGLIAVSKSHQPGCFGSTRQGPGSCVPIELTDEEEKREADIFVRRAAVIVGRVLDHDGTPIERAGVRLHAPESERVVGAAISEADGRFEIGGLPPGQVMLIAEVVRPGAGTLRSYYPGVLEQRDAQPLETEEGARLEVEIRVPRNAMGGIEVQVTGPAEFQLERLSLLQASTKSVLHLNLHERRAMNLRGGQYVLEARAIAKDKMFAGFAKVDVSDGEMIVPLALDDTGFVHGRLVAERGGLPPLGAVYVSATWKLDGLTVDPSGPDRAAVGVDGTFSFTGMFGTRVFTVVGLNAEWEVQSIRAGRSDITAGEFEIEPGSRTEVIITVARR